MSLNPKQINPREAKQKRDIKSLTEQAQEAMSEYHKWVGQATTSKMTGDKKTMNIAAEEAYKWQQKHNQIMEQLRRTKAIKTIPVKRPKYESHWARPLKRDVGKWMVLSEDLEVGLGIYPTRGMAEWKSYMLARIDGRIRPIHQITKEETQ